MGKKIKCQKCETILEDKLTVYCPECGVNIKEYKKLNPPEPKLSTFAAIGVILSLIFVFPLGVIVAILVYLDLNNKKKAWRDERLINATKASN